MPSSGESTRSHRDLDLAVRSEQLNQAIEAIRSLGYEPSLDLRPIRLVMDASDGRSVDLHPVAFAGDGSGRHEGSDGRVYDYPAEGFGFGTIGGESVPCLTADLLVRFHLGYEPQDHDRHDVALLRDRLGLAVPDPY